MKFCDFQWNTDNNYYRHFLEFSYVVIFTVVHIHHGLQRCNKVREQLLEQITVVDSNQTRKLLDALSIGGYIHTWYPVSHNIPNGTSQRKLDCSKEKESGHISQIIEVHLKYFRNIPAIRGIQQISTPGNRSYFSKKRILQYSQEQNWGESKTLFLSTKEGIITHHMLCASSQYQPEQTLATDKSKPAMSASRINISVGGGEALCLVW